MALASSPDTKHRLMTDGFGYERYAAHGTDLGAGVTSWLAGEYPSNIAGIHLATPGLATAPAMVAHRPRNASPRQSPSGRRKRAAICTSTRPNLRPWPQP